MRNIRKNIARILIVVMLVTGIGIHGKAGNDKTANAASYEYAMFPNKDVYVSQVAYGSYSHSNKNATDIVPTGDIVAPFSGTIRYRDNSYGFVWLESDNEVYWADGTRGKMCVGFMHDNDISDLPVGKHISQGQPFYQKGTKSPKNNVTGAHVHIIIYRGGYSSALSNGYGSKGNAYIYDAFFLSSNTTISKSGYNSSSWRRLNPQPTPTPGPTKDDVKLSNFNASEITSDSCKLSCTVTDKGYTRYSCKFVVGNHEYTPTRNGNTLYCYVKRSELGGGYGPHSWHASISFYELGVDIYGSRSFSFIAQPWVETSFREITRADSNALCEMTFTVHDPSHLCTEVSIGGYLSAEDWGLTEDIYEAVFGSGRYCVGDIYNSGKLKNGADGINGRIEFPINEGINPVYVELFTGNGIIDCSTQYYVSDTEGPEFYNFKVSNVDSTGYDVYAKVRDESGIGDGNLGFRQGVLVGEFCYSRNPNDQSVSYNKTYIQGDTISYHVTADMSGTYHNYFGAYDIYGNWNGMSFDVEVPAKPSATPTPTAKPTATPTNKPTTTPKPTAMPTPVKPGNSNTSSSTSTGLGDFIERLYNVALGRPSEAYGKNYWINKVKLEGFTGADVARGFLFSEEFLGKNMSNSDFLDTLYLTFFNRPADEHKADWMTLMDQGWTKMQVIDGFINSTEWANLCLSYSIASGSNCSPNINIQPSAEVESFARRLYTTCLGRDADIGGLNNWAAQLANMQISGSQAAHGFFFSEEFIAHGFSNEEYVNRLYRTFMGREADPAGFADWVGQLNSGVSRESVFQGFAGSQEWAGICAEYGILK